MKYELVTTRERLSAWVDKLHGVEHFAIDTETTSKDSMTAKLVGINLAVVENGAVSACYIPVGHTKKARAGTVQLSLDAVLANIAEPCFDASIAKVLHNAIYDLTVLGRYGVEFNNVDDTMFMSYALTTGSTGHGMDELADLYLGHRTIKFDEVVCQHPLIDMQGFQDVRLDHATNYAAEDGEVTLRLFYELRRRLKRAGMWSLYQNIDRPLVIVGADMKRNGVALSKKACDALTSEWSVKIEEAAATIQRHAPGMNVGSTKDVQHLLFGVLDLPILAKTEGGAPSTAMETLELLRDRHEAVEAIVTHRKYSKLIGTYSQALPEKLNPETRRLHPNLNFTFTNTGRLSCSDALQGIPSPAKSEEGIELRKAFVAASGYKLIAADYSQIELRILAHITNDPTLVQAFLNGADIHAQTATTVFETDASEAGDKWPYMRRAAKTINFGLIYGMSAYGLSHQLKVDGGTAQGFIDRYFAKMLGVSDYMETTQAEARQNRYVDTIFGRRIFTNTGNSHADKAYAGRQGANAKIQGSAADLIRIAMRRVQNALVEADINAALVLQVHDELLGEAEEAHAERARTVFEREMANAGSGFVEWRVPILVDAKTGSNWAEAH